MMKSKPKTISRSFLQKEKARQINLLSSNLFDGAKANGYAMLPSEKGKCLTPEHFPFIIVPEDSIKNLYSPIRKDVLDYFEKYGIEWWREKVDRYFPTGHLISSQIHCLNHLFAIRKDCDAVLDIISAIAPDHEFCAVLPLTIDNKEKYGAPNYICFEYANSNTTLLKESGNTRGARCTSIDAFIYAQRKDGQKILIPIEWKYAESYDMKKRTDNKLVNLRYKHLTGDDSNLIDWYEAYHFDPYYEFARQELLVEQTIKQHDKLEFAIPADDYLHIIVCPEKNIDLCNAIRDFQSSLRSPNKLFLCDPEKFLKPISSRYPKLTAFLSKRYWKY